MVSNISVDEIDKINGINIIDIRSIQSYNNNHIPNAINIPYEKLLINFREYLSSNQKYILYCQKGFTSKRLCQILNNYGYKTINLEGGYEEWIMKN